MTDPISYEKVRVIVETSERTFRGFLYRPVYNEAHRLSDYLNEYDRKFLCLTEVAVNERGQTHRPGEKRAFVAVSTTAITYLAPMNPGEL